jgi:hypothetical protein
MPIQEFQWFRDMLLWAEDSDLDVSMTAVGIRRIEIIFTVMAGK